MPCFLGIDTSNYTTSAALYDTVSGIVQKKKLLPVKSGECGLRQSDAVFHHTQQLPQIIEELLSEFNGSIDAIGVSSKPRDVEGSYMPCFTVGLNTALSISAVTGIPCFEFSHQSGHVTAALYSAGKLSLLDREFIAFHISGGTSEALLITPDDENIINCEIVAKSLDLKIGQAIDRAGVLMGFSFPAGKEIDALAQKGELKEKPKPTIIDGNCSISGLENKFNLMYKKSESKENISRFIIEYVYQTIDKMTQILKQKYGDIPVLYVGGVMSNSIIRERLGNSGGLFCEPEFSSDNATGIAVYSYLKHKKV